MNASGINFRLSRQKFGRIFFPAFILFLLLPLNTPLFAQVQNEVVITNAFANLRQGPAISYKLVGKVNKGERFPYVETRNDWYRIMYNDQIAWVYAKLARIDKVSNDEVQSLKRDIEILDTRVGEIMDKLDTAISQLEKEREKEKLEAQLEKPVSAYWVIIPGGHRFAHGDSYHGAALLGVTAASIGLGLYYHSDYNDKLSTYNSLGSTATADEFNTLYNSAQKSLKLSDAFFYTAAGAFAFNVVDYLLLRRSQMNRIRVMQEKFSGPAGVSTRINLSLVKEF